MIDISAIKTGTFHLYAPIESGDSLAFAQGLSQFSGDITMRINSPGGLVSEGIAIFNLAIASGRKVNVHIDGIAGSIASVIAMAGDEIAIAENAFFFLHDPLNFSGGNAEELRRQADELDLIRPALVSAYMRHANDETKVKELMESESYVSASEALALGLASSITNVSAMAALHSGKMPKLSALMLSACAKYLPEPTAGAGNPKHKTTMSEQTPADHSAIIAALTEKVDALTAKLEALVASANNQPAPDVVAELRAKIVALESRPVGHAMKPDAKPKTPADIRAEFHAERDPMVKARIFAENRNAF